MQRYGLIGKNLSYSYSKTIHEYLLKHFNIKANYKLIQTNKINKKLLTKYQGLNITIPFKQEVIKYLDSFEAEFNSCNTILNNEKLTGFNTDIIGFDYLVKQLNIPNINKVVILGKSASSEMIKTYFKDKEVIVISRRDDYYNYELLKELTADLLINTTPVGMNEYKSPIKIEYLSSYQAVIDLNYNPINSLLSLECKKLNIPFINGLLMLIKQACASFEIWHNIKVSDELIKEIELTIYLKHYKKIALIGMPLTGKTTLIKRYNGIDLDEVVVLKTKHGIDELIEEGSFREYEHLFLKELVDNGAPLIALGGGAILDLRNIELLNEYLIIYYYEDLDILKQRYLHCYRPLLKDITTLEKLYELRTPLYKKYANITMNNKQLTSFLNNSFTYQLK